MRIASVGHAVFAAAIIALGILGLITGDFASVWQMVPDSVPARQALAYVCALVSLAGGIGLLWQRSAAIAARVVLAYVVVWFLLLKVPGVIIAPQMEFMWLGCAEIAVLIAGALVLHAWLAANGKGLRFAQLLLGVSLIPMGLAHWIYVQPTVELVPAWLPAPVGWVYLTAATYIAASVAVLTGVRAQLAATLTAAQMGGFTLLVWVPKIVAAPTEKFQWAGALISLALAAGALVVADSYRSTVKN